MTSPCLRNALTDLIRPDETARLAGDLLERLYPICRSITGDGVRQTLAILSEHVPLELIEIPTGTEIFDWEIPDEWTIRDAYIRDDRGRRVVDFRKSNLHVVGYSVPVRQRMSRDALEPHLHTLPELPDAIPYRTAYYERTWGFCLTHRQYEALTDGVYDVCIDSELRPGALVLAEAVLPGERRDEILFSTYCCHPSMANNELSGPIVQALLYRCLSDVAARKYTYRFYLGPETIGALAYLAQRGEHLRRHLRAGLVLTCCGDAGPFTYKRTRQGDHLLDKIVLHTLQHGGVDHRVVPFSPSGSDERQYGSPGFDLPVGSLMRSMYGTYPQYHTSLDDLELVSAEHLVDTLSVYLSIAYAFEHNQRYRNTKPLGEPHLSKYGLYPRLGGQRERDAYTTRLRYILNYSDSTSDLVDIANKASLSIGDLERPVDDLLRVGLLETLD